MVRRDAAIEVENAALELMKSGPKVIVITLGADGSYYQTGDGGGYVPPFKVETVDAVGCGDAFIAGLLTQLVQLENGLAEITTGQLAEAMEYANAVGALTSLKRGALPALPSGDAVKQFMKDHKRE